MKLQRDWKEIGLWVLGKRWRFCIDGNSMLPTLTPGEDVLVVPVSPSTVLSPGDIVVCFHPLQPSRRIVKRISETFYDGSCYVLSDNASAGSDSRSFGVVGRDLVIGKVTSRLA
ncbi:MAG: nickel-type superoxide dismutase maturation protease [Cyanobacteria bacterium J06598_3]